MQTSKSHKPKRLLSLLLTLCMVLTLVPLATIPAYAAPGDSEADPLVCTTFAELKAAMESPTVQFIKLSNVPNAMIPNPGGYDYQIYQATGTTKTLILEGTSTFSSNQSAGVPGLIYVAGATTTLNIKGTGTLRVNMTLSGGDNCVIRNDGGTINMYSGTLYGNTAVATYSRAIMQTAGTLNVYGGTLRGNNEAPAETGQGALRLEGGTANIFGGDFRFTRSSAATEKTIYVISGTLKISGGFFQWHTVADFTTWLATPLCQATLESTPVSGVRVVDNGIISTATATVTAPVGGANPVFTATSGDSSKYTAEVIEWIQGGSGFTLTPTSTFEAGSLYEAKVRLTAQSGCSISDLRAATINGMPATFLGFAANNVVFSVTFTAADPPMSSASATITAPAAGATPDFSPVSGSPSNYTASVYSWVRVSTNSQMAPTSTFIAGETYRLNLLVTPTAGNSFTATPTVTINSTPAMYVQDLGGGKVYTFTYTAVDNTVPTVTSVTPSGTGVSGNLIIIFNKIMGSTHGTVTLNNGGGTLTGGTWIGSSTYSIPYSGLNYGTTYTVTISGFRDAAATPNTMASDSSKTFTTRAISPPLAPNALTADPKSTLVNLSWGTPDSASPITGYEININGGGWTPITGSGPLTTGHIAYGLTDGTAYTFQVRAVSAEGNGTAASVTETPLSSLATTYTIRPMDGIYFPTAIFGYSPISPVAATIYNTGTMNFANGLNIAMTSGDTTSFILSITTTPALNAGNSTTFTVKPKDDLPVGSYYVSIAITDPDGNLTPAAYNMSVYFNVGNTLVFTNSAAYDIPASVVGTAITPIDVSGGVSGGTLNGGTYRFYATGLPAGISISQAGTISGTPTLPATAGTATIHVYDDLNVTQSITINYGAITEPLVPLAFTGSAAYDIPSYVVSTAITPIDVSLGASGGVGSYTFSATGLPTGITISSAGVISGTTPAVATAAGTATITVTDSATPVPASQSITINYGAITNVPLSFIHNTAFDIPASFIGMDITSINVAFGVSGGTTPYTFSASGLPAGISITTTGIIYGAPTTEGAAGTATITATDSLGSSKSITIAVGARIDGTAPTLSAGSVTRTSDTAATIGFTTDKAGTAYYLVLASGAAAPTSAAVKAGTSIGAVTVGANTGKAVTLTAGARDIYVVVEDAAGNISIPLLIPASAYTANNPPTATAVNANAAAPRVGTALTGSYTYTAGTGTGAGTESGTTIQWYRSTSATWSGSATVITGATSASYTPTGADVGMYLYFQVTPSNGTLTGTTVQSAASGQVGIVVTLNVVTNSTTGTATINSGAGPVTITSTTAPTVAATLGNAASVAWTVSTGGGSFTNAAIASPGYSLPTLNASVTGPITITATFTATPALGGTASISGTNAIGQLLTVGTGSITGGSGAFSYQWQAGGVNMGTNSTTYTLTGAEAGKAITCVVTRAGTTGSVTASFDSGNTVPYNIAVTNTGNVAGDTVVTLSASTGRAGNTITLNYVLGDGGGAPIVTNTLTFTGATGLTNLTAAAASTTQGYTVNAADAVNGVITITATFVHSTSTAQTLTFALGNQTKTFGDAGFTNAATSDKASTGTITYNSSNMAVATVTNLGAVTIVGAGTTTITADITDDGTFAAASASYTITVNNASQSAPTVGKTDETAAGANNGTITGVTTAMEYKLSTDTLYTAITGTTVTGLAPGTYHVRYAAKTNYNAGADATVTIAAYTAPTTYAIGFTTNGVTANGITATGVFSPASPTTSGTAITVTITLTGTATAAGTHTVGLTSASAGTITSPASVTKVVTAGAAMGAGDTYVFTFTMPANAVTDLVVTHTFSTATPTTFTITFDPNGGSVTPTSGTTGADGRLTSLPTPTRSGSYSFNGWFTAASGGTAVTTSRVYTSNDTIYAQWTYTGGGGGGYVPPTTYYTVTFDLAGGTRTGGGALTQSIASGGSATAPTATRDGYTFDGWDKSLTGIYANTTVTAKWTPVVESLYLEIYGVKIPVTFGTDGILKITLTKADADKIIAACKDGNIIFDLSIFAPINGVDLDFDPAWFNVASVKTLTVLLKDIGSVTLSKGVISKLADLKKPLRLTIRKGSLVFDILTASDGKSIGWYDYKDPILVTVPVTGANFVMKKADKIIPRSWAAGNTLYALVYTTGKYESAAAVPINFTDTAGKWMDAPAKYMSARGVISGIGDNLFAPDRDVTRGEFVTMLMRALAIETQGAYTVTQFTDVQTGKFYYDVTLQARALGIVSGIGDNKFDPENTVTRQDMFLMLYNAMEKLGLIQGVADADIEKCFAGFTDANQISDYARKAMATFIKEGIVSGKGGGILDPKGTATRAEAAQIIYNMLQGDIKNLADTKLPLAVGLLSDPMDVYIDKSAMDAIKRALIATGNSEEPDNA